MRSSAVNDCKKVLAYYGVDPSQGEVIDIGGTPIVWLDTKPDANPLIQVNPRLKFLDKGFNIEFFNTDADHVADFLDPRVAQSLENTFDLVFCFDTLEHVTNPFLFCQHLLKITKPRGYVYASTLFSWGYHPSPGDYFRFSPEGLHECFSQSTRGSDQGYTVLWCDWESDRRRVAFLAQKGVDHPSTALPPLILPEYTDVQPASGRSRTRRLLSRLADRLFFNGCS